MKKGKLNYLTVISGIILVFLVFLVINIIFEYYGLMSLQKEYASEHSETPYTYHCAFITDNYDNAFWDSVYESARDRGKESGIFVENFGKDLSMTYSTDELLKMAISANVDAIIVEPTVAESTTDLINEASEKGIPVATVYRDALDSRRFSFTGVNNFRMGYKYGELALQYSDSDRLSVTVFLNNESSSTVTVFLNNESSSTVTSSEKPEPSAEQRVLMSGIGKAFQESDREASVDTLMLNSGNTFDIEDQVRAFMKDSSRPGDIIICTDLAQTQAVSQTAIDLNYVGDFTIIGTYESVSVLEALKNGVIAANIIMDTGQMGQNAVSALEEYLTYGHASDYLAVNTDVIDKEDAILRLAAINQQTGGTEHEK